jgi:hypothetical protein
LNDEIRDNKKNEILDYLKYSFGNYGFVSDLDDLIDLYFQDDGNERAVCYKYLTAVEKLCNFDGYLKELTDYEIKSASLNSRIFYNKFNRSGRIFAPDRMGDIVYSRNSDSSVSIIVPIPNYIHFSNIILLIEKDTNQNWKYFSNASVLFSSKYLPVKDKQEFIEKLQMRRMELIEDIKKIRFELQMLLAQSDNDVFVEGGNLGAGWYDLEDKTSTDSLNFHKMKEYVRWRIFNSW